MGVITAVWAGLLAAVFGGSQYNIVGPTGALSGLLATYALLYGVQVLPWLALLSGVVILAVYVLRLDRYIVLIPSSVIHGFTLGVAFIIGLNQLNFAFGLTDLPSHEHFIENVFESMSHLGQADLISVVVFVLSFLLLLAILRWIKKVPGPIVVAVLGIILGWLSSTQRIPLVIPTLASKFGEIPSTLVQFPVFSMSWVNLPLIEASLAIAIIAILETLISAKIADGMTKTRFDRRKEVFGLGLANVVCGFAGGIPATAALARTALNVHSGATHKTSGVINALVLAVISLMLLPTFKFLPLPIVAAILVIVAIRMVKREHFAQLYHFDKKAFWLSMIVAAITVGRDPIIGILFGAAASLLLFVNEISKGLAEITIFPASEKQPLRLPVIKEPARVERVHGDIVVYRFAGQLNYINAQSHHELIREISGVKTFVLSFRNLFYIDLDGLDALAEIIETLEQKGIDVVLTSIGDHVLPLFKITPWFRSKESQKKVYLSSMDALDALRSHKKGSSRKSH